MPLKKTPDKDKPLSAQQARDKMARKMSDLVAGYDPGPTNHSWAFMQTVSLWFLGAFKLFLWFRFLIVLWLTL